MHNLTGRYEIQEREVLPNGRGEASHLQLDDDEVLLDTALSRQGMQSAKMVAYVAVPTTAVQCMALTADETRCQRDAEADSDYCALPSHGGDD